MPVICSRIKIFFKATFTAQIKITKHSCKYFERPTFAIVQFSLHILYRKISAALLLALFVLIYAEKVLHTHDRTTIITQQKGVSVSATNPGCAICDFAVAKDAALPSPFITDVPLEIVFTKHVVSSSSFYHASVACSTDRGPPAI